MLYDYQNSRAGQCARDYLKDFRGYLQVDGYAGYEQNTATLAECWALTVYGFQEEEKLMVEFSG